MYLVDNICESYQKLADSGVITNRPPRDGCMAFIRSPEGISIELLQKGDALAPAEPWASKENKCHWEKGVLPCKASCLTLTATQSPTNMVY